MTGLLIAWVLFPLVLGALSLGCGLLVEAASGIRLRGALLLPTGFAAIVVMAQLVTQSSDTARFAPWVVAGVALAGLLLTRPWRRRPPDGWAVTAGLATFGAYAAPIVLSGSATIAGWIKLEDGAYWLAIADRMISHGRSLEGVPASTYQLALEGYLGIGYPVGAYLPFGVGGRLINEELAWLLQPYMAFAATMLALAIYALASRAVEHGGLRALVAFVAAQPALLYGYVLWGGLKEAVGAALIATAAAAVPVLLEERSPRAAIPLALVTVATVESFSVSGGLLWLAPILLPTLLIAVRARRIPLTIKTGAALGVTAVLLAIPAVVVAAEFFNSSRGTLTSADEYGTLFHPLRYVQVFGIWPTGDFRFDPDQLFITYVLIAVAALAAACGLLYSWRRGAPEIGLYLLSAAIGAAVTSGFGSPWVEGKGFTLASAAFLATAAVGASMVAEASRRRPDNRGGIVAIFALIAVTGGVLWSNVLAYHDARLAPRDQLEELRTIGQRPENDGPALMVEPSTYGGLYFLRRLAPEVASMIRTRPVLLRNSRALESLGFADIDAFALGSILPYRTLVLNRTANASRPPSLYRLVWSGQYYEVWQRREDLRAGPRIVARLPLGGFNQPATTPPCDVVRQLALEAGGAGGSLATVIRDPVVVAPFADALYPATWETSRDDPNVIYPTTTGTLSAKVTISRAGKYGVWLGGSFQRALEIRIDGRTAAKKRHRLNNNGAYTPFGIVELSRGPHDVQLIYTAANVWPGSGGPSFLQLGPLVLGRQTADLPLTTIRPNEASTLCGQTLDWIEAVRRSR